MKTYTKRARTLRVHHRIAGNVKKSENDFLTLLHGPHYSLIVDAQKEIDRAIERLCECGENPKTRGRLKVASETLNNLNFGCFELA